MISEASVRGSSKGVRGSSKGDGAAFVDPLARAYVDFIVRRSPETATGLGIHDRDDDLDDRSEQGIREAEAEESALLHELEGAAPASGAAATDRLLIQRALRVDLRVTRDVRSHERDQNEAPT